MGSRFLNFAVPISPDLLNSRQTAPAFWTLPFYPFQTLLSLRQMGSRFLNSTGIWSSGSHILLSRSVSVSFSSCGKSSKVFHRLLYWSICIQLLPCGMVKKLFPYFCFLHYFGPNNVSFFLWKRSVSFRPSKESYSISVSQPSRREVFIE